MGKFVGGILNRRSLEFFLEENKYKIRHLLGTDWIMNQIDLMEEIYIPASVHHPKVFPKYKGINKGKSVVLVGTGPTQKYYEPMDHVTHMGMNYAIFRNDIKFDYYMAADFDGEVQMYDKIFASEYDFVKLFAITNNKRKGVLIPEYLREREHVETFYIHGYTSEKSDARYERDQIYVFPIDLSVSPLKSYGSSFYCLMQFALWTHPEKIYLVGADAFGYGHSNDSQARSTIDMRCFVRPWKKLKEFARYNYPDIEIISINPVGLKGIFKDEYTSTFLKKQRE